MNPEEKRKAIEELLIKSGWNKEEASEQAEEAIDSGEPILESLCFQKLAEHILAPIHTSSWITKRANRSDAEEYKVIRRLLDSGATPEDLALFARLMQREYLSNLGCLLDGAGIYGTPKLPCEDFRIFAIEESGDPKVALEELHESLGFSDLETEMKLSRDADT